MYAGKGSQCLHYLGKRDLQFSGHGHGSQGVRGAVASRQAESQPSQLCRAVHHRELDLHGAGLEIAGAKIGLRGQAVGDKALFDLR